MKIVLLFALVLAVDVTCKETYTLSGIISAVINFQCPELKAQSLLFDNYFRNDTDWTKMNVDVMVEFVRFIGINDLEEKMSLFATITLSWKLEFKNCSVYHLSAIVNSALDEDEEDPYRLVGAPIYVPVDATKTWVPQMIHQNAFSETHPFGSVLKGGVKVYPFGFDDYAQFPVVQWKLRGKLESKCNSFSFAKFPFDTQKCEILLESEDTASLVTFKFQRVALALHAFNTFMGQSDIWDMIEDITYNAEDVSYYGVNTTLLTIGFTFRRKHHSYVMPIFIPLYLFQLIQMATLLLPPETSERSTFNVTVVLAYAIVITMVSQMIPTTSEIIYLQLLVNSKYIHGSLLTIYQLVCVPVANFNKKWRLNMRKLDYIVAISSFVIIAILDSLLFYLMTQ